MERLFCVSSNNASEHCQSLYKRNMSCFKVIVSTTARMTLTRIVTILIFAVLAADYSHGCNQAKLLQCSQKYLEFFRTASSTDYEKLICRSDVISYGKCVLEEGQACGILNQYTSSLGYSSWTELEKACARLGQPISRNAAKQTLPSAVTILGLLTALLIQTF